MNISRTKVEDVYVWASVYFSLTSKLPKLKNVTFVSSPLKILTFQQSEKEFLQAMNYFWKGEGGLFTIVSRLTAWVCFLPVITLQNIWLKRENTLGCLFNKKMWMNGSWFSMNVNCRFINSGEVFCGHFAL